MGKVTVGQQNSEAIEIYDEDHSTRSAGRVNLHALVEQLDLSGKVLAGFSMGTARSPATWAPTGRPGVAKAVQMDAIPFLDTCYNVECCVRPDQRPAWQNSFNVAVAPSAYAGHRGRGCPSRRIGARSSRPGQQDRRSGLSSGPAGRRAGREPALRIRPQRRA
jgi:hypothetical protein